MSLLPFDFPAGGMVEAGVLLRDGEPSELGFQAVAAVGEPGGVRRELTGQVDRMHQRLTRAQARDLGGRRSRSPFARASAQTSPVRPYSRTD